MRPIVVYAGVALGSAGLTAVVFSFLAASRTEEAVSEAVSAPETKASVKEAVTEAASAPAVREAVKESVREGIRDGVGEGADRALEGATHTVDRAAGIAEGLAHRTLDIAERLLGGQPRTIVPDATSEQNDSRPRAEGRE